MDYDQADFNDNRRHWASVARKKDLVIAHTSMGKPLSEACRLASVHITTERKWRQTDEKYRAGIELARNEWRKQPDARDEPIPADFQGFVTKFFPDRNPHLPHQLAIVQILQTLRPSEVVLLNLWPEAGKTATLEDYICRKLALDPGHRFRVVSQTGDHSKNIVGMVKRRMTDTAQWGDYIERFGPFYEKGQERNGRPWGAEEITVHRNSGAERDKSLVASSWSSATTGSRIDTVIFDDVQVPENYNQADKIFDRLRAAFFTRGRKIRTLIIGHRIGPGDVYERMIDAGLVSRQIVLPASGGEYHSGDLHITSEPGMPTVPGWWVDGDDPMVHDNGPCCGGLVHFRECPDNRAPLTPLEAMELKKHMVGDVAWYSMYQQDPTPVALTTFGASLQRCLDTTRSVGPLVAA